MRTEDGDQLTGRHSSGVLVKVSADHRRSVPGRGHGRRPLRPRSTSGIVYCMQVGIVVLRVSENMFELSRISDRQAPIVIVAEACVRVKIRNQLDRRRAVLLGWGIAQV